MEEWKFLVQKDGDRSWLPLDSPDVEILEGRYRIVARLAQANTEVQICIGHVAIAEEPPKRRFQKRSSRTNADGLMVVIPYTYLSSGIWEFSCFSPDPISDLIGDTLHHSVRLQVFAPVLDSDENWDGDDSEDLAGEYLESASAAESQFSRVEASGVEPDVMELSAIASSEVCASETPTTPEIVALNVEIAQALGLSMERLVAMTEHLSHQLIEEVFQEFGAASSASETEQMSAASISVNPSLSKVSNVTPDLAEARQNSEPPQSTLLSQVDARAIEIVLEPETFQASAGRSVVVVGHLVQDGQQAPANTLSVVRDREQPLNGESGDLDRAIAVSTRWIAQELRLSLRNPQTSEVVFSDRLTLATERLPYSFNFKVELPPHSTTHLLTGAIELWGAAAEEAEPVALKTATLTITVNPDELMAEFQRVRTALDQEPDGGDLPNLAVEFSERLHRSRTKPVLDLSFLDLTSASMAADNLHAMPEMSAPEVARPAKAKRSELPPQLSEPQTDPTGTKRPLDLPTFIVTARTTASTTAVQEAIAQEAPVEELNEPTAGATSEGQSLGEAEIIAIEPVCEQTPPQIDGDMTEKQQDGDVDSEVLALIEQVFVDAAQSIDTQPVAEVSSPIRSAFQALRLQDRFFDRLSVLAADEELLVALKESVPPEIAAETHLRVTEEAVTQAPTEDWVTHEVVVDDDPMWQEWMQRSLSRAKRGEALELPFANPLVMPKDAAIPVPVIEILTDEIVAGRPMNLRLKLPNLLPKIYIKLWVNDRQTRSLLDGPRWMVDFFPNGHDELEAVTQLTVPFGTLAIRLEAIAVEVQTQRESAKISLDCEVIPPDFPELPIEDFIF